MLKTINTIAVLLFLSGIFFMNSCINNDIPDRTAEMEKKELDEAIAKLEKANYNVDTTGLGIFYVMNKVGEGPFPSQGDTCSLIYTGFYLNGTIFDSSGLHFADSVWVFNYLQVSLIPGFNNGISLLNEGAEADIIIPSSLAYGATGYGEIPAYTPLVFNLKMKKLRQKK